MVFRLSPPEQQDGKNQHRQQEEPCHNRHDDAHQVRGAVFGILSNWYFAKGPGERRTPAVAHVCPEAVAPVLARTGANRYLACQTAVTAGGTTAQVDADADPSVLAGTAAVEQVTFRSGVTSRCRAIALASKALPAVVAN